ncbi:DUF4153 domain-containing protein [Alkalibacter mobilis]|uniref:DUF4153 domain-containing protein n=1 Tax=Alkalibacter mobilis TaxID=2787712 RepID=UPI00189E34A0|nr:DUF4153 domain-containing protein [Alkalibacter mobilis]MBF7097024.1 DUF4153 domain-containing protein [Alkalibacter mobilis]
MKLIDKFKRSIKGLTEAVGRYPLTVIFLVAGAVINAMAIENTTATRLEYNKLFVTFIVGAVLATVAQVAYEKFFKNNTQRLALGALAVVLDIGYYLIIRQAPEIGIEIAVRTTAIVAALLIGFIWIPSMKNQFEFTKSFMGSFKSFFISVFFSGVLFAGIALILGATDVLLFEIDEMLYAHSANIVFTLFAPIYFLSLIPNYNKADQETIERTVGCPRFLEILISYIVIPLVSIFTVILVLYIGLNIRGEFWTENLIEPMLVSYSIVVIVVLFLSANMDNKFAATFRQIFPKVLLPLVAFQILASTLKIGDEGLTHSRYYVIMYGVFAAAAGVVFSFMKSQKAGIIAAVFVALSIISVVPPVDAFGVSKRNQIGILEEVLEKNDMLVDDKIVPNASIPDEDKKIIINTSAYIWRMDYFKDVAWLGEGFDYYGKFEKTFGFPMNEFYDGDKYYANFFRESLTGIDVSGYDFIGSMHYYGFDNNNKELYQMSIAGKTYTWGWKTENDTDSIYFEDADGNELMVYDFDEVITRFDTMFKDDRGEYPLTDEESIFTEENEEIRLKLVIQYYEIYPRGDNEEESNIHSEFFILVDIVD